MKKLIFLIFILSFSKTSAQRFEIISGKLENLKVISEYHINFDYKDLMVHGFESEEAFLKDKMDKRSKVEGKAENFKNDWFENREKIYEPAFVNYFNEKLEKNNVKATKNPTTKYSLDIKITWIYPGYFSEPAKISAVMTFFETANPKNKLLEIEFDKVIGFKQNEFTGRLNDRITGAYEKLAKNLMLQMKRFL